MLQGLDYMLMAPLDDEARSMLLFPTFPTGQWDVRFKMHAPLNTTVEASCQGALTWGACNSFFLAARSIYDRQSRIG